MQEWLNDPVLLSADPDADYAGIIEINLNEIQEPLLACPNDPDFIKTLSQASGQKIDEVFIGSCMIDIAHLERASRIIEKAGHITSKLLVAPPTRIIEKSLKENGGYSRFIELGARMEIPGCSLCMGNQARVADNAIVFSTSTRNFDNRMGKNAQVYLGSAEVAAIIAVLGKIPTLKEYFEWLI